MKSLNRLRAGLNLGVRGSATISPTAHYTGYVWVRHKLGPRALATSEGAVFYNAVQPLMLGAKLAGLPRLEDFLLARHRVMDHLLTEAIESGEVGQVIEIAAGMSPRGYEFHRHYGPQITYVDTDLPGMAATRRRKLTGLGTLGEHHRVVELDALANDGPLSLAEVAGRLDHDRGIAVVTEGLLNYLPEAAVRGLWSRIAALGNDFPTVRYFSDLHLSDFDLGVVADVYRKVLGAFVRGETHLHFASDDRAEDALHTAGFSHAVVHNPTEFAGIVADTDRPGSGLVRVVDATAHH